MIVRLQTNLLYVKNNANKEIVNAVKKIYPSIAHMSVKKNFVINIVNDFIILYFESKLFIFI